MTKISSYNSRLEHIYTNISYMPILYVNFLYMEYTLGILFIDQSLHYHFYMTLVR